MRTRLLRSAAVSGLLLIAQLACPSGHQAIAALILYQNTFENTSGIIPNDFQFTTTNNPMVKMEVYNRRPTGDLGFKISIDPPAGTFPTKSANLDIRMPATNKVYLQTIAEEGTRYDPDKTFFTLDRANVRTKALTLAPDLKYLGGNNWAVVLTNVNGAPVTISALTFGFDDPGDPYAGGYIPGGTLMSISPPVSPLLADQTLTEDFTGNPNFTVSFQDIIALSSDPSDQFLDVVAERLPEPSSLLLIGFSALVLYEWRRCCAPN